MTTGPRFPLMGGTGRATKARVLSPILLCGHFPNDWSLEPQARHNLSAIRWF